MIITSLCAIHLHAYRALRLTTLRQFVGVTLAAGAAAVTAASKIVATTVTSSTQHLIPICDFNFWPPAGSFYICISIQYMLLLAARRRKGDYI